MAPVPEVNFSFIHSIDVSLNPHIKSFKPGTKPVNYEMNHEHKTFNLEQKKHKKKKKL